MDIDLPAEARKAVSAHLRGDTYVEPCIGRMCGVFVTIRDREGLRGCIGYVEPGPLYRTLCRAAVAAATQDMRFDPLRMDELDNVRFEVTILDEPSLIRAETAQEYMDAIKPGRDGLIVRRGDISGLLLPQVASEYGWTALQLVQHTCIKAGLDQDAWMQPETDVYRFGGRIYSES